eukprot:3524450-Pyramimonas_sp.AAC.1
MFGSYTKADKLVIRPADRVALGTGKDNERVVVFISVNDDPKLPIGTLVKVRFRQEAWYTVERAGLHTDTGTCDQFTLGPGLFFSDGPKVTFTHTGSGKVYVTDCRDTLYLSCEALVWGSACTRPPKTLTDEQTHKC